MKDPYRTIARYYDRLYAAAGKDYKRESMQIDRLIRKHKKSKGKKLLDVACGTGGHIRFLKKNYEITGIDCSKHMLDIAMKKPKGAKFVRADMRNFRLGKFDAIICMFSAFNYMRTRKDAMKALKNFYDHLEKGGVLVLDVFTQEQFDAKGRMRSDMFKGKDMTFIRVSDSRRKGEKIRLHFWYFIKQKGETRVLKEVHDLGAFRARDMIKMLKKAGFSCAKGTNITEGKKFRRPVFVARK